MSLESDQEKLVIAFSGALTMIVVRAEARGLTIASVVGALVGFAVGAARGLGHGEDEIRLLFEKIIVDSRDVEEPPSRGVS